MITLTRESHIIHGDQPIATHFHAKLHNLLLPLAVVAFFWIFAFGAVLGAVFTAVAR